MVLHLYLFLPEYQRWLEIELAWVMVLYLFVELLEKAFPLLSLIAPLLGHSTVNKRERVRSNNREWVRVRLVFYDALSNERNTYVV